MSTDTYKVRDVQPTVLRLHPDLRARLVKDAKQNGRSLTKEIEVLLLQAVGMAADGGSVPLRASEPGAGFELSKTEASLLNLVRKLSPEKQLALLSLLK